MEKFLKEVEQLKIKQSKQKERGLNDYNLLTTVLKPHDEVRLHSRMIGSLLNPDGKHYQNTLFLEIFLKTLDLNDFFLDINRVKLELEYKNIDLYLTDGNKHIIIENKVYAGDQPSQIKRYILELINDKKNELNEENLLIIYLTIDRDIPSAYSLGKENDNIEDEYFEIKNDKDGKLLTYKGNDHKLINKIFRFKSIHYIDEILKWLDKSKHEIQNITNLNEAIKQYIEVVKLINGIGVEKVDQLESILEDENNFKSAVEVYKKMAEILKNNKEVFYTALKEKCKSQNINFEEFGSTNFRFLVKELNTSKLKIQLEPNTDGTLSATLYKEVNKEWQKNVYPECVTDNIAALKKVNILNKNKSWGYFEIPPIKNFNFENKLFTKDYVSETVDDLISGISEIIKELQNSEINKFRDN